MNKLSSLALVAAIGLSACGVQKSRVYKKQRTPTDIKIEKIDLANNTLALRFNYRSYVEKSLENIQCDIKLNKDIDLKISKSMSIQLGAFATEVLIFDALKADLKALQHQTKFAYSLTCQVHYDQGQENISESSVLHLAPGEKFIYR